jgi:hypothetical protein
MSPNMWPFYRNKANVFIIDKLVLTVLINIILFGFF